MCPIVSGYHSSLAAKAPFTVHVVEDDDAVREALSLVVAGEGYACRTWRDGETFLAEARLGPRDLVFLDIGLPGMSGVAVAEALSQMGETARVAIISGLKGHAFDAAVARVGPQASLRKPVDVPHLLDTLAELSAA